MGGAGNKIVAGRFERRELEQGSRGGGSCAREAEADGVGQELGEGSPKAVPGGGARPAAACCIRRAPCTNRPLPPVRCPAGCSPRGRFRGRRGARRRTPSGRWLPSTACPSCLVAVHTVFAAHSPSAAPAPHMAQQECPLHLPRTSEGQYSRSPSVGTEPTPPGLTNGLPPGPTLVNGSGRGPAQAAPPPLPRPSSRCSHELRSRTCPPWKAQVA